MPAFRYLARSAEIQFQETRAGRPPDVQTGADATIVAHTLFRWIAENVEEAGRDNAARAVNSALGLEE